MKLPVEQLNFNWFIWGICAVVLNAQQFGELCVVKTDGSLTEIVLLRQYRNGLHVGWSVVRSSAVNTSVAFLMSVYSVPTISDDNCLLTR